MKKSVVLLLLYMGRLFSPALNLNLAAQTRVDLRSQSSNVDFTGASATKPIRMDNTLPPTCAIGEFFFRRVSATDGLLFSCLATDVWTQQGTPPTQSIPSGSLLYTDGNTPTWTQVGGDLSGSPANLQVVRLRNQPIGNATPQTGQALIWTGTEWSPQFGAGQSTITVKSGSTTVSTNSVANLVAGSGISISLTPVSGETQIQHTVDTGLIETRMRAQSGEPLFCSSTAANGLSFSCTMTPAPTALATGMLIHWRPTAQGAGGATTLQIGPLTAVAVKLADGSTDPSAADIVANQIYPIWFDGTVFRMITSSSIRTGTALLCSSASASATAYTCSMSPALPVYQTGVVLNWRPDVAGTGGATTLRIGALAAVAVKLADGSTDPSAADIVANQIYPIWFDGTVFRMITSNPVVAQSTVSRPACAVGLRGRIWHVFGAPGTKDTVTVCAKDAANAYDWRVLY